MDIKTLSAAATLALSVGTASAGIVEVTTTYIERGVVSLSVIYSCMEADQVPVEYNGSDYRLSHATMPAKTTGSYLAQAGDSTVLLVGEECLNDVKTGFTSVGLSTSALVITPK